MFPLAKLISLGELVQVLQGKLHGKRLFLYL